MKAAIYTGYCLFEAGDRGNTKPGPIMATSVGPTSKKTLGSACSRANLKFQKTSLQLFQSRPDRVLRGALERKGSHGLQKGSQRKEEERQVDSLAKQPPVLKYIPRATLIHLRLTLTISHVIA
jgi:hypothetical protein